MKRKIGSLFAVGIVLLAMLLLSSCSQDGTGEDGETDGTGKSASYELKDFTLIYDDASKQASEAAVLLYNQMKDAGIAIEILKDSERAATEGAKEILVGKTDRTQTAETLSRLKDDQEYAIAFAENTVAITASNDLALNAAVQAFLDQYVSKAANGVIEAVSGACEIGRDPSVITLMKGGTYLYRIVVSRAASEQVKEAADRVAQKLEKMTGAQIEIVNDEQCNAEDFQIVIGNTKLSSSQAILGSIDLNAYVTQPSGKHLVIAGHSDKTITLAVNTFVELILSKQKVQTVSGEKQLSFYLAEPRVDEYNLALDKIPEYSAGSYKGTYPCANDVTQKYYEDADVKGMISYIRELNSGGYLTTEDRMIGKNRYVTCVGENGMVHLTYLDYNKSLTVISDPLTDHVYKESEPSYEKLTDANFVVMSRDYSVQNVLDGNGQSYVMTLEDGRYIIIDGGYSNSGDDDALYNYMTDHNVRKGKPVIAAWIFTHSHGDHYGAFETFTKNYASKVSVEYFIFNTGTEEMYREKQHSAYLEKSFEGVRAAHYADAQVIKPHAGQVITFCNTELEVLYTQENYAPNVMPWENDSSLVLRIHMGGKTFLIMGDCEASSTTVLCAMYGDELKSDVVQVNHHGYSGGTNELYDLSDPSYVLWTTSQAAFDLRVSGAENIKNQNYGFVSSGAIISNRYVYLKVGAENCFVADGEMEVFRVVDGEFVISYEQVDFEKRT